MFIRAILPKIAQFGYQKMVLWLAETENGDHFFMPTSPQNGGLDICFMRFPILVEY